MGRNKTINRDVEWIRARCSVSDTTGCWVWNRTLDGKGYGNFRMNGKRVLSHRASYRFSKGLSVEEISGKMVCHSCDNPPCCNPGHLWLGTMSENTRDSIAKGRYVHNSPRAKLEDHKDEVAVLAKSMTLRAIGARFGVHDTTVGRFMRHRGIPVGRK